MKKFFRICTVFLLILALAACGTDTPPVVSGSSSGQSTPVPPGSSTPSQPTPPSQTDPSGQPDVPSQPGTSSSESPAVVPSEPLHIPELTVELPRSLDTATARKAMQALPQQLAEQDVIIDRVSVSFGPSYSATAAALRQGSVQLAFLPAEEYLELGGMALLMTDAYPGPEGSLSPGISALICAGPSDYGAKLAEIVRSRATPLTWAELDHARWGVLSQDSLEGYLCPQLWLQDNYQDNAVSDLSQVTVYDGWDALLQAAAAGEIDLFPLSPSLQQNCESRWQTDFGGTTPFTQAVQAIGASKGVCTWVAAAAPEDAAMNDPRFPAALEAVLGKLFESPARQQAAIGAERYVAAQNSDLDPLRRLMLGTG